MSPMLTMLEKAPVLVGFSFASKTHQRSLSLRRVNERINEEERKEVEGGRKEVRHFHVNAHLILPKAHE